MLSILLKSELFEKGSEFYLQFCLGVLSNVLHVFCLKFASFFLRYWIQIGIRQSISTEAYGGTMSCVAVEANCRFAVFAATLMYESRCRFMGLIGPASDMLFFWPFLHHF